MNRIDRLILFSAWGVIAAGLGLGILRISSAPAMEPSVVRILQGYEQKFRARNEAAPPPLARPRHLEDWGAVVGGQAPAKPWAAFVQPVLKAAVLPPPRVDFFVLPDPTCKVQGGIDRATITWSLKDPETPLEPHEIRRKGTLRSILIERQVGEGAPRIIARLTDPKASSYLDYPLKGRTAYRYRVLVEGDETLREGPVSYRTATVTRSSGEAVRVETPSHYRVRLVGGDAGVALMKWETYNGETGNWYPKTAPVKPGEKIGPTGWTLDGLRFYKFTLTADVTDDSGEQSVLSTKD